METANVAIGQRLVRRLLAEQFPQWAGLALQHVESTGTDNVIFRLGERLAVRLPRVDWAAGQAQKEHRWLPVLAPSLPLPVPAPLALGAPADGYPWPWSVCRWLEGESVSLERVADEEAFAADLAGFVAQLHQIDATGGPAPGAHNFHRGALLAVRDRHTRAAIAAVQGGLDPGALTAAWEAALAAPAWSGPPVWIHGDLQGGNLLCDDGRLSAVIDFGGLGVGDPACDLIVAWNLLTAKGRAAFRSALDADDASWARGRGWALSASLVALSYYRESNPAVAGAARRTIAEILAEA
ncbi:MAG: aminoglycoside phosphotransferase family protein [Caulobacteraceae bacterium]|nr:aminoglycoside phosphotransferase family protein [Caulobacteraceae bacterium]